MKKIKNSKTLSAVGWEVANAGGKQLVGLAVSIVLARLLSPSDFGVVGMAAAFIVFSEIFIDAGLSNIIIQSQDDSQLRKSTIFFLNLSFGLLLTVTFFCISDFIGKFYGNDEVSSLIKVYSFSFILRSLGTVQEALIRKNLQHKRLAQANLLGGVIGGGLAIALVLLGFGYWSLVIQSFVGLIARLIWLWKNSTWRPTLSFSIGSLHGQIGYGMSMFVSSIITSFFAQFDTFIIGKYFNSAMLGQLYRAKSFVDLVHRFMARPIGNVFFPYVSKIQDDANLLADRTVKTLRCLIFVLCPAGVMLFFLAEPLVIILFGKQWLPAVPLVKIFAVALHVSPLSTITAAVLAGKGRGKEHLGIELTKKFIQVTCQVVGLWWAGVEGFLWGLVVAGNIGLLVNAWSLNRTLMIRKVKSVKDFIGIPVIVWSLALVCIYLGEAMSRHVVLVSTAIFATIYSLSFILIIKKTNYLSFWQSDAKLSG